MTTVALTGATGFVGTAVIARLAREPDVKVRALVRNAHTPLTGHVQRVVLGDLRDNVAYGNSLAGVDAVVHLAARVHVTREDHEDALESYRHMNVHATLRLARAAIQAGVRRFLFLSSAKVNGETGLVCEEDRPRPSGAYAVSKHEAEVALGQLARAGQIEVTVVRPPLVYGPGVRANFLALVRAIERGMPLPFAAVRNRRSLVAVDNLADLIVRCLDHPSAANETFLVSDGEDVSTPELVRRLAKAMGRPARLVWVPPTLLMAAVTLAGRRELAQRLLGSFQVDASKARHQLGWEPPLTVEQALRRTVTGSRR